MKSALTDVSECKKTLDIEIPTEVVEAEITHIAQELTKRARVPGFRPGRAPLGVVKARFRDEIVSEMMQHLMPKAFEEAIEEQKLEIIRAPKFELIDYSSDQPLRFKAMFEVYPKLDITNYIGIPIDEVPHNVEEPEVEAALQKIQEDMAELVPVEEDRQIRQGDFAEISFTGKPTGTNEPPITAEKVMVEVGGRTTLKEFTENLLETKAGEEKTFAVSYRPDYPEKRLAGKTVEYTTKVEAIKQKELPDIDDEFAQRFGDYKTLDELKVKIREDIEKHKAQNAQDEMRDKLLEWLEDNNEFEIPESLLDRQIQVRGQRLLRDLSRQGIDPQRLDVDWSKIRTDQERQAARDVKGSLILEYIAEKEGIRVTNEDTEAEIERVAAEANRPKEKVREVLTRDSGLSRLEEQIRHRKTLQFLQEKAHITQRATA